MLKGEKEEQVNEFAVDKRHIACRDDGVVPPRMGQSGDQADQGGAIVVHIRDDSDIAPYGVPVDWNPLRGAHHHDYLVNNLKFTLDREPDNATAADMIAKYEDQDPDDALVTTLAQEREVNTFFRLQSASVIARLRESFPEIGDGPDPRIVFLKLRELRNRW